MRKLVATAEDPEHLNFTEDSFIASGNSEIEGKDNIWPHHLHKSKDGVPHMEKVFSIVRQRYGLSLKRPGCERSHMRYIYARHSSSCSSSWYRQYGEFSIYQESIQEIIETVVSSDSEADTEQMKLLK